MSSQIVDTARSVTPDGRTLNTAAVVELAHGSAALGEPDPESLARVERSWHAARELALAGRVYGRNTGVGANRTAAVRADGDVDVDATAEGHGLRLLRSHAGAVGSPLPAREVRAMLTVRANQLLAGGAGLNPQIVLALLEAVRNGAHPVVREHGAVGTGDLAALAQTGLALLGEQPWTGGPAPRTVALDGNDALAFISSNALTLGQSALALDELCRLQNASLVVAALSLLAVGGSYEAYAEPVHRERPHPGSVAAAARMRVILGAPARPGPPSGRIQDPYGFRCVPQIHGPALDSADTLAGVLEVDLNAAAENPLISADAQGVYGALHHGSFYAAHAASALDGLRLAVLQTARLSTARLVSLVEPGITGLRPFLSEDTPASSGVMILEYAAGAALAELTSLAQPASLGHAVLSRGVEEVASFASLAARHALRMPEHQRQVLACELVAAIRALRQRGTVPDPGLPVGRAYELAAAELEPEMADRPLSDDVDVAVGLLDRLSAL
ncbi:aromatic amino acid lyase [Streptomyces bathyalis]|uniref:Aromatic amino acid lyase n=1 Tax=Streptomyces bathyalis TaxID=2710756 RepID=A0A7T1T8S2_9ACTN|nr:aromatic amino acid ammonia-lyase [Streptomyces bathyalis]QPP08507.1 aromatic amino acid lyase [Streptomyces bathyalis]